MTIEDISPVASDHVQIPIHIPITNGNSLSVDQSTVVDLVVNGLMKAEDSLLIQYFFQIQAPPTSLPNSRSSLFYPSAGKDILTPVLLGLPFCTQFFFYDFPPKNNGPQFVRRLLRRLFGVVGNGEKVEINENKDEIFFSFEFGGCTRAIYMVGQDNLQFLNRDVDLAFYFHRGDSWGEGGSGQEWDRRHIWDLLRKTPKGHYCNIITDGEPGEVDHFLREKMIPKKFPANLCHREYYFGVISWELIEAKMAHPKGWVDLKK